MLGTAIALILGLAVGAAVALFWGRRRSASVRDDGEGQYRAAEERATALAASVAELYAALDALAEGVVLVDARGVEVVRNRQATHFLGVSYLDALVEAAVESHLRDALAGRDRIDALQVYGPPRRTLIVRGSAVTVDGRRVGALATIEDASERVRLDSVRTDLVANLSHELKTPVGAIALLAETLADEDEPEVIARLAPKLITEAHRLARIIDELLELSRIELGGQSLAEAVEVGSVVEEAVGLHGLLAAERGIDVHVEVSPDVAGVVGNRRQLLSAVSNLVENAIKYSDPGSVVGVSAASRAGGVELVVRDHGIGIPARDLDRIFERFYRVDKARSRETGGSGLGLSIVRHVMANHGGDVAVTSVEGEGSTFTLRIPLTRTEDRYGMPGPSIDVVQTG